MRSKSERSRNKHVLASKQAAASNINLIAYFFIY